MNDEQETRYNSKPRKNRAKKTKFSSDVVKYKIQDDSDIYSYSGKKGIDLLSKSSKAQLKRKRIKLIFTNIFLSLVLIVSSLVFAGTSLLDSRIIDHGGINQDEKGEFADIIGSSDKDVSYFLICGVDLSESLTDVIMVGCYDLENNQLNILQIPRDTYVGREYSSTGKINAVFGSAKKGESKIKALMRCINNEFMLPIDHYVTVTIEGTEQIIDAVGGVEVNLERSFKLVDDTGSRDVSKRFGPGKVLFDGQWGTAFIRHRNSYVQGDIGRVKAQRSFYASFAKKMTELSFNKITGILTKSFKVMSTDMTLNQILGFAQKAKSMDLDNINIMAVPGQSGDYNVIGYRQSYWSVHKQELVNIINQYFMPYEEKLFTVNDLGISELHQRYSPDYNDFLNGNSFEGYTNRTN